MMSSIARHLAPCCEQVLETMFFTGILAVSEDAPAAMPFDISATVAFTGPPDGLLSIALSRDAAAALASSFLGVDLQAVSATECSEVAGELANMICGALLSRATTGRMFRLAGPDLERQWDAAAHDAAVTAALELPEGNLRVRVCVDQ
jgi:CheY-specific phosphatase CheX